MTSPFITSGLRPNNFQIARPSVEPDQSLMQNQVAPPEAPQGLLSRIGGGLKNLASSPDFYDRMAVGLGGMTTNPNTGLIKMSQDRIQRRAVLGEQKNKINQTIQALRQMNSPQSKRALQLLQAGGNVTDALKMVYEKQAQVLTSEQVNTQYPTANVPPDGLYNVKANGEISKVGGSGTTINLGDNGVGDFQKEHIKSTVGKYSATQSQAQTARFTLSQVSLLGDFLSESNTGLAGGIKQKLYESLGLDLRSDTQVAAEAMLSKLVPAQREKGSGPMSDRDLDMFRNALPSLKTTPEGNALIVSSNKNASGVKVVNIRKVN